MNKKNLKMKNYKDFLKDSVVKCDEIINRGKKNYTKRHKIKETPGY